TPRPGDEVSVGWVEPGRGTDFYAVGNTRAWNWQQGCMLQWLGTSDGNTIFYNDCINGQYVGVMVAIDKPAEKHFVERPLYAVMPNGRAGVSVDFERLHRCMSGYGYSARCRVVDASRISDDDGIWMVNLENGRSHLLLSLAQVVHFSPRSCMRGAEHYLNHLEFSPTGDHLCFVHRWHIRGSYYTRLYTMRVDGSDLRCLADTDLISHHAWLDGTHLLAWARQPHRGDHFFLFDTEDSANAPTVIAEEVLTEDGHPSFSPDRRSLLVDTYPDGDQRQSIFLLDLNSSKRTEVGKFRQPIRFNDDVRCD